MKTTSKYILTVFFIAFSILSYSQAPNFHIYLSFGQSNMEGAAKIKPQDTVSINSRFKVMAAVDCPDLGREKGNWYTAVPPLCRCKTGLTLTDFFGRSMVKNLPENINVGVINVAVGGCKIELFDKDKYKDKTIFNIRCEAIHTKECRVKEHLLVPSYSKGRARCSKNNPTYDDNKKG